MALGFETRTATLIFAAASVVAVRAVRKTPREVWSPTCSSMTSVWRMPRSMAGPIVPAIDRRRRDRALELLLRSDIWFPGDSLIDIASHRPRFDSAFGQGAATALLALALDTTVHQSGVAVALLSATGSGMRLIDSTLFRLATQVREAGKVTRSQFYPLLVFESVLLRLPLSRSPFQAVGTLAMICALRDSPFDTVAFGPEGSKRLRRNLVGDYLVILEREGQDWMPDASEDVLARWPSRSEAADIRRRVMMWQ